MELKGELDSIGLAQLIKTVAAQKSSGVIAIKSDVGEKLLALMGDELVIVSDLLSDRPRLGEFLIVRGHVSDAQLSEALRIQRVLKPPLKLGDVLIKRGMVQAERIEEAMGFQAEEELWDLLTWKHATFEMQAGMPLDTLDMHGDRVLRHKIDLPSFLAELTRRAAEWKQIEARLPTQNLAFKLSSKGEEALSEGGTVNARVLALLKDGHAIETVAARSCLGRFTVCQHIIRMLENGLIFPYPVSELRALAKEHRSKRHYSDALCIYRRLLETSEDNLDRSELESLIFETQDTLRNLAKVRDTVEGSEIISHKQAALAFRRRRMMRRLALGAFCVAALAVIAMLLIERLAPVPRLPEWYNEAARKSGDALDANQFDEATRIWEDLYASAKGNELVQKYVAEKLATVPRKRDAYIAERLAVCQNLEAHRQFDEAETILRKLQRDVPVSAQGVTALLKRIADTREALRAELVRNELAAQLGAAQKLLADRNWSGARKAFDALANSAGANADQARKIEAGRQQLAQEAEKCARAFQEAQISLAARHTDEALAAFERAALAWPGLDGGESARQQAQRLKLRQSQLAQLLKQADEAEKLGHVVEALSALTEITQSYSDFEAAAGVKERLTALTNKAGDVERKLAQARMAVQSGHYELARQLLRELFDKNAVYLAGQELEIPIRITTIPAGALVSVDGKEHGKTPQDVVVSNSRAVTLQLSKPGYKPEARTMAQPGMEDLELQFRLKREPVRVVQLDAAVPTPTVVLGDSLYVLQGNVLNAFDLTGTPRAWSVTLFPRQHEADGDGALGVDTSSAGKTAPPPRVVPETGVDTSRALESNRLLLALPTNELIEIETTKKTLRPLLSLPAALAGPLCYEPQSLLAGKAVLVAACADGSVRGILLDDPPQELWNKPFDPNNKQGGKLVAGPVRRPDGSVLTLSSTGHLSAFNLTNGEVLKTKELGAGMSRFSALPASPQCAAGALLYVDGRVAAFDLNRLETLWQIPAPAAMDEPCGALAAADGLYVVSPHKETGVLCKYGLSSGADAPLLWQATLDGPADLPLALGKAVFAVTSSSTLYAFSPADGHMIWSFVLDDRPLSLSTFGDYVYVTTAKGQLLVMNAE